MTDYKITLYKDYPELFDLAEETDKTIKLLLEEFNQRHLKLFDLDRHKRIFLFIITRSIKTYSSILELCKNGYGQDVSTLLRGLLENLITARYILHDQKTADDKAARFVAYKWIILKRQLAEQEENIRYATDQEKNDFLHKKKTILERVDEFKQKYKITSDRALMTWSGKTIRDMAHEVDPKLLEEYETTFRLCSRFSHPTILGDREYLIQDDKSLIFSPLPSSVGVIPNLKNTIRYTLEFMNIINNIFNFRYNSALKNLEARCHQIFEMGKYKNDDSALNNPPQNPTTPIRESIITFKTKLD